MTIYVRAYSDYSYEIIFLEGIIRKSRLHLLVNPSNRVGLPGQSGNRTELNIESLTHLLAMETSVKNQELIKRTTYIAERTNKPIITNQDTAELFKKQGLSVKQLRIIGFTKEVVDGLQVDPVYLEELTESIVEPGEQKKNIIAGFMDVINPMKWKPIKKISQTILNDKKSPEEIDASKPLAFNIDLGNKTSLLLPLDKRGVLNINRIIPQLDVHTLILPNQDVAYTREITSGITNVVILGEKTMDDEVLVIPKSHNTGILHDTYYGALEEWIEIK